MTKRLTPSEKQSRKPTRRACTFCHTKHLSCSETRPCQNCIKRKIAHQCQDIERKKASYLQPADKKRKRSSKPQGTPETGDFSQSSEAFTDTPASDSKPGPFEPKQEESDSPKFSPGVSQYPSELAYPAPADDSMANSENMASLENVPMIGPMPAPSLEHFHGIGPVPSHIHDHVHSQNHDTPSSTRSNTANFNSIFLNQEYMMLGDIISKPASPSPSITFPAPMPRRMVTPDFLGLDEDCDRHDSRPYIALGDAAGRSARENGFNFDFRSDDHEYVSPLLSHHIYQTVQDIYSNRIINFDYPSSYHSLTHFLKGRFSVAGEYTAEQKARKRSNLLVILKLIASYRPAFISAHKSLFQPFDFQFLEMSFQRCLLDFENLSRLNASPMIIWRRTGEIVSMSAHLADILGLEISDVLSKRTFIMELMYDDESIVEYFRLFKSVAIGNLHSTIFTKCKLIKKPSEKVFTSRTNLRLTDVEFIEFCSVWTVKRDLFDLPMMIVGHFLPILPNNDAIRSY